MIYIIGRLHFMIRQVSLYTFVEEEKPAKAWAAFHDGGDYAPNSVMFVIYPDGNVIFACHTPSRPLSWKTFDDEIVYDAKNHRDVLLSEYISRSEVEKLINEALAPKEY